MSLRLVLIEDHQALREGLELLLSREGCEVVGTAGDAASGQTLVERERPDVALVDIRLGEDDGIALTRTLLDAEPERRIMLYTGSADEERLFSGLDAGAQGYALKDGSPRELVGAPEAHTRVHAIAIALREGFISPPADAGVARG